MSHIIYPIHEYDLEKMTLCPVCDGRELAIISSVEVGLLPILATAYCGGCGMVFRSVRPKIEWFEKSWAKKFEVNPDLTSYVVGKAVDALFEEIAKEEADIRSNPLARTTEILRKVFGRK